MNTDVIKNTDNIRALAKENLEIYMLLNLHQKEYQTPERIALKNILRTYMINMMNEYQNSKYPKTYVLKKKIAVYLCILYARIFLSKNKPKVLGNSMTSEMTYLIANNFNIIEIENYVSFLRNLLQLANSELQCLIVLIKKICEVNDGNFFTELGNYYDAIFLTLIILVRKINDDCTYENVYYCRCLYISRRDVFRLELKILSKINAIIYIEDYNDVLYKYGFQSIPT